MQKTKSSSSTTTTLQRAKRPSFQKRNSTHRRQGDLLESIRVVYRTFQTFQSFQTFQTFQSFMIFQPFQAILQILHCSSISRESNPFQHSPIRMHILSPIRMHILQFDWFPENFTEYQLSNYKHYILQRKGDVAISVKLTYSPE